MLFLEHIWLIPLLPAVGAAIMFFFGRRLQKATVSAVCVGTVALAFLMACGAVLQYTSWADANHHQPYEKVLYTWLGTDTGHLNYVTDNGSQAKFQADAGFLLDPLSSIWLLFVTGVGMLIHIYSTGYMAHEGGYYRFFGYLNLFMFSMLTLILANNYVLMFVGWEGVGLCSYLLIGFYFQRKSASDAANKAFIVNRIGDAGFILGMFFIAWHLVNRFAPEHLSLPGAASHSANRFDSAGSIFLGDWSAQSFGDYATGTNHVLPTGGVARARGGLSTADFVKCISVQEVTRTGLARLAPVVKQLAKAEGLLAHARAVEVRE